jgi:beta-lactamase class A
MFLLALFVSSSCDLRVLCGEPSSSSLESRLAPLAKAHKGKVAIAVKHLGTGETYYLNADEPMPTASLIKLPIMAEAYFQAAEGKLKLTDPVTLRKEDKVPGSGVLTNLFSDGVDFPLVDAVRLMIAVSDNTATNLVLDKVGIPATAERMEKLGLPNTKAHSKVYRRDTSAFPERSKQFGLGSTTAREMVTLLEKLNAGKLVSPEADKEMIAHLRRCDDDAKFPRFLPEGVSVAHKTGSVSDARTDAGILSWKGGGPVALCVLTDKNEDKRFKPDSAGNVLCAQVAKEVYEYFNRQDAKSAKEEPRKE